MDFYGLKRKTKFKVLHNGLDTQKISYINENEKKLKSPARLGMVGNFYNDTRDQKTLCEAAKLLNERSLKFNLEFAGGARKENTFYFDQCVNYVENNGLTDCVKFLGFQDDVFSLIVEWDIFIYSSNRDTFGIAVVEAMLAGIPVIVNDLDVFVEITENGTYATLYKSKDPEDLAEKIKDFLKNPESFYKKAQRATVYARENYSIEKHVEDLQKIYQELMHA